MRAAVWNARAALLYSLGGWTALGGMIFYSRYSSGGGTENENDPQTSQGPHKEVYTTETPFGLQVRTEVTYREDQPPITRLLRRLVSFFDSSGSPPSGK
ncbi:small integral membrane protein 26 isoform X2 [Neopelma chrysocephalum]|uniref:small integral membrane protein 26 isoform X2 n=1 Tax=Neopelma chrysocephalum TaxID=114329 RepID=UPI000FCCFE7C|nr:small integral membrane protein 26 isoform X2 [Neopelma chrysocephalum]